jgi:hypothetical protein
MFQCGPAARCCLSSIEHFWHQQRHVPDNLKAHIQEVTLNFIARCILTYVPGDSIWSPKRKRGLHISMWESHLSSRRCEKLTTRTTSVLDLWKIYDIAILICLVAVVGCLVVAFKHHDADQQMQNTKSLPHRQLHFSRHNNCIVRLHD